MPPARPRALDDSRSETSSTIGIIKEKNLLIAASNSGVAKTKRTHPSSHNNSIKTTLNTSAAVGAASADVDPSLPRTDWTTISPALLRSYRSAYRLSTQAPYTYPHSDLIYSSSATALRAPSAVLARRRLRDLKHQRRKAAVNGVSSGPPTKTKAKQKEKDNLSNTDADHSSTTNSDNLLKPPSPNHQTASHYSPDDTSDISASQMPPISTPSIPPEHIGKQTPATLATTIRKHFNAQQLSEAETVARFSYVVRQTKAKEAMRLGVSDGDGMGHWMGSHGREVRRGEGGEVGFRLRFRP